MGRISKHLRSNVYGLIAVFIALSGTAYATHPDGADTISTGDIINGQVQTPDVAANAIATGKISNNQVFSADVRDDTLANGGLNAVDLAPDSVGSSEVAGESLTGDEVADESLTDSDIADESLTGDVVANNSLTGDDVSNSSTITGNDINESTLSTVPSASKTGNQSLQKIQFNATNGSGASGGVDIGRFPGLEMSVNCDIASGDLSLTFNTRVDNASLAVSDDDRYFDVEDFDIASGDVDILTPLGGDSDEIINFVYVDGTGFGIHNVVSGQLQVLDEAPAGTVSECLVAGHAIFTV